MADKLVEIERHYWSALRDLYSPENPEDYLSYCLFDYYIRWTEQEPGSVDIAFYSLNGDWSDGTFLALWRFQDGIDTICANSLGNSHERFLRLFGLVDFSRGVYFKSLMENAHAAILQVIKSKDLKIEYQVDLHWYRLPKSEALSIQITPPDGITLKPIAPSDVHIVDGMYPHPFPKSLQTFQTMARLNPSVGAFNADGRLIAWAFRWSRGGIAALQVDEEFKRRGLGTLVVKAISRKIAEAGHDAYAAIDDDNEASQSTFKKLGFSSVFNIRNVRTLPPDFNTN